MEVVSSNPIRRTVSTGKRTYKRRRAASSSAPVSAGLKRYLRLRGTPKGVYEISRTVTTGHIAITGGAGGGWNNGAASTSNLCFVFTPQYLRCYNDSSTATFIQWAIPNASELAALYDDVKISSVELTFMGSFTQSGTPNTTVAQISPRSILYGTDDNDTATSYSIVSQLGDCKTWYPNNTDGSVMRVTVKPKYNQVIYYTPVLNGYQPQRGYIRSDYDIEHYALKMSMVDHGANNPNGAMTCSAKFNFKFKNLK